MIPQRAKWSALSSTCRRIKGQKIRCQTRSSWREIHRRVGLNLGWNGNQLVLLVSAGSTVTAYNATSGAPVGSFTTPSAINSIGSTDTLTVVGNLATNTLEAINLTASLQAGTVQPALGSPKALVPTTGFTLLGGLTGVPGSNTVYAAVGATFDSFQPLVDQLGTQAVNTVSVQTQMHQSVASYNLSSGSASAFSPFTPFLATCPTRPSPERHWAASIKVSLGSCRPRRTTDQDQLSSGGSVALYLPQSVDRTQRGLPPRPRRLGRDRYSGQRSVDTRRKCNRHGVERHRQPQLGQIPERQELHNRRPAGQPPANPQRSKVISAHAIANSRDSKRRDHRLETGTDRADLADR